MAFAACNEACENALSQIHRVLLFSIDCFQVENKLDFGTLPFTLQVSNPDGDEEPPAVYCLDHLDTKDHAITFKSRLTSGSKTTFLVDWSAKIDEQEWKYSYTMSGVKFKFLGLKTEDVDDGEKRLELLKNHVTDFSLFKWHSKSEAFILK